MTWTDADITTPERALEQIETDTAVLPGERQDILAVLRALAAASRAEGWKAGAEAAAESCEATMVMLRGMAESLRPYAPGSEYARQAAGHEARAQTLEVLAARIRSLPLPAIPPATGEEGA